MVTIFSRSFSLPGGFAGFRRNYEHRRSGSFLLSAIDLLMRWQERADQRHALAELDDRLLRDIGLDRVAARREARKPFWQP